MPPLQSQLFAGDPLLQSIADDETDFGPRISKEENASDPAVLKVQTALLDWDPAALPQDGADGKFGEESAKAVKRFKVEVLGVPPAKVIRDVGPMTVRTLDQMQAERDGWRRFDFPTIDLRDYDGDRLTKERERDLREKADALRTPSGGRVAIERFDVAFGTVAALLSADGGATTGVEERAVAFAGLVAPVLGVSESSRLGFAPISTTNDEDEPAVTYLAQTLDGFPIYGMSLGVRFTENGFLARTAGRVLGATDLPDGAPAAAALAGAAAAVLTGLGQGPLALGEISDSPGGEPGGKVFAPADDRLRGARAIPVWFPVTPDDVRSAWQLDIDALQPPGAIHAVVDSKSGEILLLQNLAKMAAASGTVYEPDPRTTVASARPWPRPTSTWEVTPKTGSKYTLKPPSGFPASLDDWVAATKLEGHFAQAVVVKDDLDHVGTDVTGTASGSTTKFDVAATPAGLTVEDHAKAGFYWVSWAHDVLAAFGAKGRYEFDSRRTGGTRIRLEVARERRPDADIAAFYPATNPWIQLLPRPAKFTTGSGHTAGDASIILHEYAHGVFRLFLWAKSLHSPNHQLAGADEGFGDFIAVLLTGDKKIGGYGSSLIRDYTQSKPGFEKLGTAPYDGGPPPPAVPDYHPIGEIWCQILLDLTDLLGPELALAIIINALKYLPQGPGGSSNPVDPSFIDLRDGILLSVEMVMRASGLSKGKAAIAADKHRKDMWKVFAKRNLGRNAKSVDGSANDKKKLTPDATASLIQRYPDTFDQLSPGWSAVAALPGPEPLWVAINAATKELTVDVIDPDSGLVAALLNAGSVQGDRLQPLVGGRPGFAAYDPSGHLNISTIDVDKAELEPLFDGAAPAGDAAVLAMNAGKETFVVAYSHQSGQVRLDRVTGESGLETLMTVPWVKGLAQPVLGAFGDDLVWAAVDAAGKLVHTAAMSMGANPAIEPTEPLEVGGDVTHVVPLTLAGKPHLAVYSAVTGSLAFTPVGTGPGEAEPSNATLPGWTSVLPLQFEGAPQLLFYDSVSGACEIDGITALREA